MAERLIQYPGHVEPVLVPPSIFVQTESTVSMGTVIIQSAGMATWNPETPADVAVPDQFPTLTNQPYLRHPPRQTAGATWTPETPLAPDVTWAPQVQQPLFRHKRRQTAGAVWNTDTPAVVAVPDISYPLTDQPPNRHPRRQTAGAVFPFGIPPSIFVSTQSTQVFADRVIQYKAKAEGFVPIVPAAVPDFILFPEPQIVRRVPRALQDAFEWNSSTPLAPDVTWQPQIQQPLNRHKRRQTAGAVWNTSTPLSRDVEWLPLTNQPLFRLGPRQTAGEEKPRSVPPLDLLDIVQQRFRGP